MFDENKQPYYVTDLIDDSKWMSWTIHGAYSHQAGAWAAIVKSGIEAYTKALEKVVYHSNDQRALLYGRKEMKTSYLEARRKLFARKFDPVTRKEITQPVDFSEIAKDLWHKEKQVYAS